MKNVKIEIEVDDWVKWIAKDSDGKLYGYQFRPEIESNFWQNKGKYEFLCLLKSDKNWKNSLIEVKS